MLRGTHTEGDEDGEAARTDRSLDLGGRDKRDGQADAGTDLVQVESESVSPGAVRLTQLATISTGDPKLDAMAHGVALARLKQL